MQALPKTPFPVTFRELWLPPSINGLLLPSSVEGGHLVTLTGARLGSTVDGARFRGGATDNLVIPAHGDQQNKAAFHVTIRFRFPEGYAAGDGSAYLFNWDNGGFDYIRLRFGTGDGKIYFEQGDVAAGNEFQLVGTLTTWVAGQWYTITARLQDTPEQELYRDGTSVASSAVVTPIDTPAGGDIIIGNSADGGANGAKVDISFVLIGMGATAVVAIDDAEVADLAGGIPPVTAKVQYFFPMDEGRGVTVTNRGNATGDGTLDTGVAWKFGQVEQPALSLNGINDHGQSSAGVDISLPVTWIWVGKMKARYDDVHLSNHYIFFSRVDVGNAVSFYYSSGFNGITCWAGGGGASNYVVYAGGFTIDDYAVIIGTLNPAGVVTLYLNGNHIDSAAGVGPPAGMAISYLGATQGPTQWDISKPLMAALIDGVFTQKQARAFSRWLKDIYNLPISV